MKRRLQGNTGNTNHLGREDKVRTELTTGVFGDNVATMQNCAGNNTFKRKDHWAKAF